MSESATITGPAGLDLPAYLERIGAPGWPPRGIEGLRALHLAHATRIPFENIDVLLRRPVRIDLRSIQDKLVRRKRGGYCFEHNTLFCAALESAGYTVRPLAGRVRLRVHRLLPRTHMLLLVDTGGASWIADVGFGAEGLLLPVRFEAGVVTEHYRWRYRVVPEGDAWVLQSFHRDAWEDLYVFTLDAQYPVDFEMANHFTSTHPSSRFLHTLMVQRPAPEARWVLRNRTLLTDDSTGTRETRIEGDDALLAVLRDRFGLDLPAGTAIPFDESWG